MITKYDPYRHEHQIATGEPCLATAAIYMHRTIFMLTIITLSADQTIGFLTLEDSEIEPASVPDQDVLSRWHLPSDADFR